MDACYLQIDGTQFRVDKVTATYEVWTMGKLPFPIITIKVSARAMGDFHAVPNVAIKNLATGECEYTSGIGDTVQEAVEDAIRRFYSEVRAASETRELEERDFVWT